MSQGVLRVAASRGVLLLTGRSIAVYLIRFGRSVVLARLLLPADFGVFGLAVVLFTGLRTFTAVGSDRYLIQKARLEPGLVTTAWTLNILRGFLVAFLLGLAAPVYAGWMEDPGVEEVLRIMLLAAAISGFSNPGRTIAEREVRFGVIVAAELLETTLEAAIVIGLGFWLGSAEALAWGLVAGAVVNVAISFLMFSPVGWPSFHLRFLRELIGVGRHILVISIGTFITTQMDNLLAGILFDAAAVGLYVLGYRLASLPLEIFFAVTNRVAIPVLSRLQDQTEEMARHFRKLAAFQIMMLIPMILFLVLFADPLVSGIYGQRWAGAVPVVQALAVLVLGRGLCHVAAPYLVAKGRFDISARTKIAELLVFFPAVWVGGKVLGIAGLAFGAGVSYVLAAFLLLWAARREGGKSYWSREVFFAIVSSLPGAVVALLVLEAVMLPNLLEAAIAGGIFGLCYVAVVSRTRWPLVRSMGELVRAGLTRKSQ